MSKKRHEFEKSPAGDWCNACGFPESNRGMHLLPGEADPGRDQTRARLRVLRAVDSPQTSIAVDATAESANAGEMARSTAGGLRRDIYDLLGHPSGVGLATHQMQAIFQRRGIRCPWQSISARVAELKKAGVIEQAKDASGQPRTVPTGSDRPAAVYVLTPAARAARRQSTTRRGA